MKNRCLPPAWGIIAVLLAGCATVGPEYVRPDVPVPLAFKESAGWKWATPADAAPRGSWWQAFGDPELDALIARASLGNRNVQAAEARYRQAFALVAAARAARIPAVTGDAALSRGAKAGSAGNGSSVSTSASALAGLSWEVDLWGRIRRAIENAESAAQASAADLGAMRLSLQATLAQSYLQLCANDAQRRLLDDTVAAYERALTITRNRYQAGVAQKSDVTQAEAQLQTARAQIADLAIQRAQLEHAIAVLIGLPPAQFSLSSRGALPRLPDIPTAVPASLLERRPDIAAAERRAAAANAQIGVAEAALYPSLTLGASAGLAGSALADLVNLPHRVWSVGPALAATLFDNGALRAQTAQAQANYDTTVATYRQTVLTAFQEVEDNLAALAALRAEWQANRAAEQAAAETLRITQEQYKAGTVSYLNVVIAQNTYLAARRGVLDVQGRQLTASVNLMSALGGGWTRD